MMVMCARPAASRRPTSRAAARDRVDEREVTGIRRLMSRIPRARSRAHRFMDYPEGMKPSLTQSQLVKELAGTAAKLDSPKLTGEKRMALLRRQAQLGDLRDMMAERARRAQK